MSNRISVATFPGDVVNWLLATEDGAFITTESDEILVTENSGIPQARFTASLMRDIRRQTARMDS